MSKKEKKPKKEDEKEKDKPAEGAEAGAEGEATPKKSKKKLIIIVGAVVLIGIIVGVLFLTGIIGGGEAKTEDAHGAKSEKADDKGHGKKEEKGGHGKEEKPVLDEHGNPVKPKPIFFDVPDLIVNLNSPSPRPHFVNLKMTLEITSAENLEDVKAQLPRITDSFNTYLREVRREDLQGSAGTYRLKKELSERLNKILGEGVIADVLIREIIVQ